MEQNKTGKYLKYAIGEIVLVMVGILLALQVNNWNEERKEDKLREELILTLIVELNVELVSVKSKLESSKEILNNNKTLRTHIANNHFEISLDSVRTLAISLFRGGYFDMTLTAYEESKSSGRLRLLNDNEILEGYSNILDHFKSYAVSFNYSAENYFQGASWELRKTYGTIRVLTNKTLNVPERFQLSDKEYIELIKSPTFYSYVETIRLINNNMLNRLKSLNGSIEDVIQLLKSLELD